jgi:hypothetical protein
LSRKAHEIKAKSPYPLIQLFQTQRLVGSSRDLGQFHCASLEGFVVIAGGGLIEVSVFIFM